MSFELPQPWPNNPWTSRFRTVRASPPGSLDPGLRVATVESPALGGRGELFLHVPPGAELPLNAPVAVLLHGVYGSAWNWPLLGRAHLALDNLVAEGRTRPMVLAMPSDGMAAEGTAYLAHPGADYEAWIIDDVLSLVEEMVTEVTAESPILLAGNSMGGFGAARLGARHHNRVSAIAMHSAITHLDQLAQFTVDDIARTAELDDDERDVLSAFDAVSKGELPPLYLDCGRQDPLADANLALHQALLDREIDHRYEEYEGAHNWEAWSNRIGLSLQFFDDVLERVVACAD
ncbi:MAG: alpha/beta hydrolase [Microthrixaceae bacterium]